MRAMLSRLRARDAALFVLIAGLVAAGVFAAAREAGVGERADAGTQAAAAEQRVSAPQQSGEGTPPAPLALTLSAPTICETLPAQEYAGARSYQDEEGNWHVERTSSGWTGVNEVRVTWTASGGAAPYTLQIDGEPRDVDGAYAGASGTASVSCALRSSGVFFPHPLDEEHRRYRTEPEVDSGLKTIRAVVTDGSGATAEASVEVYVILGGFGSRDVLERGKTYRVFGHLVTAPLNYDVEVGSVVESQCDDPPPGTRCEPVFRLRLIGTGARVSLFMSDGAEGLRRYSSGAAGARGAAGATDVIDAVFDELVDSVGRQPSVAQTSP